MVFVEDVVLCNASMCCFRCCFTLIALIDRIVGVHSEMTEPGALWVFSSKDFFGRGCEDQKCLGYLILCLVDASGYLPFP